MRKSHLLRPLQNVDLRHSQRRNVKYSTFRSEESFPDEIPACRQAWLRRPAAFLQNARSGAPQNDGKARFFNSLFFISFIFIFCCSSCQSQPAQDLVCFQEKCVQVEIAQKPDELTRGLQFREELGRDAGMLFIFSHSSRHSFWMKDTKIPLDMIWMDSSRRVVDMKKDVPPCLKDPCAVYTPQSEAMYVLEINSGAADHFKIHLGDAAAFRFNNGKQF